MTDNNNVNVLIFILRDPMATVYSIVFINIYAIK